MPNSSPLSHLLDPRAMAQQLIQRAHTRDGLPEIAMGLTFLLISGLCYAQVMLPHQSIGFKAAVLASVFLIPLLCFGLPWALKRVRERYLIKRLGYVQYKPISRKQIGIGIVFAILMAVALFGVVTHVSRPDRWLLAGTLVISALSAFGAVSRPDGWLLAGTGLLGGALTAWGGRLPRFVIGGVLVAATGLIVAFSGVSLEVGFVILFGFQGLVSLISGCLVFLRFIRLPIETGE